MNKREHIINAVLVGVGVCLLFEYNSKIAVLRSLVAVTVLVTLGALFPDVDTEFGRHRKTLHNLPVLGLFVAFPFVFDNLQYVWIGVLTHYVLDCFGSKRGIALFYPFDDDEWNPLRAVPVENRFAGVVTVLISVVEVAVATIAVAAY